MNRLSFTWVKHHLQRGVLSSSLVSKGLHTGQQRAGVYTSQTLPRPLRVNSLYLSQRTVFSRIRESLSNRIDDQRTKQEEAQKDNLLKGLMDLDLDQRYSMHIYKKQLETALKEGTSGWRSMIPGMKEHVGLPEVQSMLTITEVMTPTELDNHRVIRQRELKRISQKSGQPVEKVQSLLNQFNMVQMIDKWIKIRRKSNAPVPESMDEILTLMLTDRRGLPVSGEWSCS